MKANSYRGGKYWRIIVPARLNEDGKEQTKYFKTKEEAEMEIRRIHGRGASTKPAIDDHELAVMDEIKRLKTLLTRAANALENCLPALNAGVLKITSEALIAELRKAVQ